MKWLENLESGVRVAISELERLREENARLAGRVEELESKLQEVDGEEWAEERADVRQRVQKLADTLEGLVE